MNNQPEISIAKIIATTQINGWQIYLKGKSSRLNSTLTVKGSSKKI
jgi:hypothetical protein